MTHEQKLAAIWRDTHRDYKGKINGVKMILVLRQGGTHSVPLTNLTSAEVERLLPAKYRENAQ